MQRSLTADIDLDIEGRADLILQVSAARPATLASESLEVAIGGERAAVTEIVDRCGSRLHRVAGGPGRLTLRYAGAVEGCAPAPATSVAETLAYLRPSRYCQADELYLETRPFAQLRGFDLLHAVEDFVAETTRYAPGESFGSDSALTTLRTGRGVCRDYAHLVIALLRARDVPARYASCYAPGLVPMDFHAVAEAYVEGEWYALDATRLADRRTLVRIATGRDAADCAFVSSYGGSVWLRSLRVDAHLAAGGGVAATPDDHREPVVMS
ncbi:transglutaminase-like domain-containing protein [Microbacterium sp. No. 7]|uniref:transglutaminase-like domain-containing protein n=1 Tax=Microbacterium sp. No. 7 TaxID=1714373 RepID=UPI0006D1610F|nr:transglutaminase family protein [Microbacterium sp. No. 7]ALJ21212.1 transglutaminase [Microbacterium sp. No. 7]